MSTVSLRELIDKLIDIEQSLQGENVMGELPVIAVWPDAAVLRITDAKVMTHKGRINLFGVADGDRYIHIKLN